MKTLVLFLTLAIASSPVFAAKVTGTQSKGGNYCHVTKPAGCPGAGNAAIVSCDSTGWVYCGAYGGGCEVDFACGIGTGTVFGDIAAERASRINQNFNAE